MSYRCQFLDHFPAYNYNMGIGIYKKDKDSMVRTDTRGLGSFLMKTMLKEVSDFCDPAIQANWSLNAHQQVR